MGHPGVGVNLPVFGLLSRPVRPSFRGPYRCGCNPSFGASCAFCDGTESEISEYYQANRAQRRVFDAAMAAWHLTHTTGGSDAA